MLKQKSTQQNNKCRLYRERGETIYHIVSKSGKLTQKEKTRYDWVGKVIHWELCKRLNFDSTAKWYMHKPDFVLENEMQKILLDFKIQMGHLIPAQKLNLVLINEKNGERKLTIEWILPF